VEVAAQHPERQRVAAGEAVKERFLFRRVALEGGDVARRGEERPFLIEPHFADAAPAGLHEAAVPAGEATHRAPIELFDELRFLDTRIEDLRQR
jgi:hypothetical protein